MSDTCDARLPCWIMLVKHCLSEWHISSIHFCFSAPWKWEKNVLSDHCLTLWRSTQHSFSIVRLKGVEDKLTAEENKGREQITSRSKSGRGRWLLWRFVKGGRNELWQHKLWSQVNENFTSVQKKEFEWLLSNQRYLQVSWPSHTYNPTMISACSHQHGFASPRTISWSFHLGSEWGELNYNRINK